MTLTIVRTYIYKRINWINHFLLSAACTSLVTYGTRFLNRNYIGKYFIFHEEDMNEMVGNSNWDGKTFDVIQSRRIEGRIWTGRVIVWKADRSTCFTQACFLKKHARGRKESGATNGNWRPKDKIELKSCVDKITCMRTVKWNDIIFSKVYFKWHILMHI